MCACPATEISLVNYGDVQVHDSPKKIYPKFVQLCLICCVFYLNTCRANYISLMDYLLHISRAQHKIAKFSFTTKLYTATRMTKILVMYRYGKMYILYRYKVDKCRELVFSVGNLWRLQSVRMTPFYRQVLQSKIAVSSARFVQQNYRFICKFC